MSVYLCEKKNYSKNICGNQVPTCTMFPFDNNTFEFAY